jgi:hypothetical protein
VLKEAIQRAGTSRPFEFWQLPVLIALVLAARTPGLAPREFPPGNPPAAKTASHLRKETVASHTVACRIESWGA